MEKENDIIDLRKYLTAMKKHWLYYVIAFVFFMGLGITYAIVRMPQYQFYSTILIEEDGSDSGPGLSSMAAKGMGQMMRSFSIGGFSSSSVDNEMLIFSSHDLLCRTIHSLNLNFMYIERDGLKKSLLYKSSPIVVSAPSTFIDTLSFGIKIKVKIDKNGLADVVAQKGLLRRTIGEVTQKPLPLVLSTPYGNFDILKSDFFVEGEPYELEVNVSGTEALAHYYNKEIVVDYSNKKADGITLELKAPDRQMGKDILNAMMQLYNDRRIQRKNEKASEEIEFLDQQIANLSEELKNAEIKIEEFKSSKNLIDIGVETGLLLRSSAEVKKTMIEFQSTIMTYDMIIDLLNDPNNKYALIPISSASEDAISGTVNEYNSMIVYRNKLSRSAKEDNPLMKEISQNIDKFRLLVLEAVKQAKEATLIQKNNVLHSDDKNNTKLSGIPANEREYFDLYRDCELKNDLYIFLLEKRTSNALTLTLNKAPGFIVDPAYSELKPLVLKTYLALLLAFFFSLLFPSVWVIYKVEKNERKSNCNRAS